jgi:hypothetical protein
MSVILTTIHRHSLRSRFRHSVTRSGGSLPLRTARLIADPTNGIIQHPHSSSLQEPRTKNQGLRRLGSEILIPGSQILALSGVITARPASRSRTVMILRPGWMASLTLPSASPLAFHLSASASRGSSAVRAMP